MRGKKARFAKQSEHPNFCAKKAYPEQKNATRTNERRKPHIDQRLKHVFIYEYI